MPRTALALVLLAIAPLALAANKQIHKTVPLDANGRLSLSTHNGSVTITTWNQPSVDIQARIEPGDSDYPEDVQRTEVQVSGSPGGVRIESDYTNVKSHATWFGVGRSLPPIHYTISMPATAQLDINAHNATVRINGLRSDVEVETHNGRIDVGDLDGAADLETHNGDVNVVFTRFAKSSRIETHNGEAEVRVPANSRLHLEAHGHHLGFDSEFGVVTNRMNRSHYVGDVNGGGPELRFEAHNGTLRLRKR